VLRHDRWTRARAIEHSDAGGKRLELHHFEQVIELDVVVEDDGTRLLLDVKYLSLGVNCAWPAEVL
jgi:hypothetical protein